MENIKNVYIVEDDSFLGQILSEELKEKGLSTAIITSGDSALEEIKTDMPDLLILDIFLQGMNGLDLLEELRKDDKTKNLRVFVVSNTDQTDNRDRANKLGAKFIIKAAATPNEIANMVREELGIKKEE